MRELQIICLKQETLPPLGELSAIRTMRSVRTGLADFGSPIRGKLDSRRSMTRVIQSKKRRERALHSCEKANRLWNVGKLHSLRNEKRYFEFATIGQLLVAHRADSSPHLATPQRYAQLTGLKLDLF